MSFVLYLHNPDASVNKTTEDQPHWVVWNIPGAATGLPETEPTGAQLPNGAHQDSAAGPYYWAPGSQAQVPKRHFVFELYALDTTLDIQPGTDGFATRTSVLKAMDGHVLGKAVYVGLFHRPKPKKGNRVGIAGKSGLFEVVVVNPLKLTVDLKATDGQGKGQVTPNVPWTSLNFQPTAARCDLICTVTPHEIVRNAGPNGFGHLYTGTVLGSSLRPQYRAVGDFEDFLGRDFRRHPNTTVS